MTIEIPSIDNLQDRLRAERYIPDRGLTTAVYLSLKLQRPLFLEGEAGVGKTEIAKVLANILQTDLIRLQCYEGLDANQAIYEWNYTRQIMQIRLSESQQSGLAEEDLFNEQFLLKRPLLQALQNERPAVLLIDEIDRSDAEFEAFLLEILSDFQITIPEIGTIKAQHPPVVIITSNRTREVHDALKRRCLYHWIDYPSFDKELEIITAKIPDAPQKLAAQVTHFVQQLRDAELYKIPGIAETLDWTNALLTLNQERLSPEVIDDTLGVLLKYHDDIEKMQGAASHELLNNISQEQ